MQFYNFYIGFVLTTPITQINDGVQIYTWLSLVNSTLTKCVKLSSGLLICKVGGAWWGVKGIGGAPRFGGYLAQSK
jgi:hypothetical protein